MNYLSIKQTSEKWGISVRELMNYVLPVELKEQLKLVLIGQSLVMQKNRQTSELRMANILKKIPCESTL